jgi:hypothetical protein
MALSSSPGLAAALEKGLREWFEEQGIELE